MMTKTQKDSMSGDDKISPTIAIIEALADVENVSAADLDYALYDYIDTDALETLANGSSNDWFLRFSVNTHTVTIDNSGCITVDGHEYSFRSRSDTNGNMDLNADND